jgi:hypothetical protein
MNAATDENTAPEAVAAAPAEVATVAIGPTNSDASAAPLVTLEEQLEALASPAPVVVVALPVEALPPAAMAGRVLYELDPFNSASPAPSVAVRPEPDCRLCRGAASWRFTPTMGDQAGRQLVCACIGRRLRAWATAATAPPTTAGDPATPAAEEPARTPTSPMDEVAAARRRQRLEDQRELVAKLEAERDATLAPLEEAKQGLTADRSELIQEKASQEERAETKRRRSATLEEHIQAARAEQEVVRAEATALEMSALGIGMAIGMVNDEIEAIASSQEKVRRRWEDRLRGPRRELERLERRLGGES